MNSEVHATLIGVHIHEINRSLALEVSLSDQSKAEVDAGPSECEKKGMWRVFIQGTEQGYYPQMIPYAGGCWHVKNNQVWIETTTFERSDSLKLNYPTSVFKTMDVFKGWPAYARYTPITVEQAKRRKQKQNEQEAAAKIAKEREEAISYIEHLIRCATPPFPSSFMKSMLDQGMLRDTGLGISRVPVYAVTQEIMILGRKLLFVSSGGSDTENFRNPIRPRSKTLPTRYFAITLDELPQEEAMMAKRPGNPLYKSSLLSIKKGALNGSDIGVTLVCGYRSDDAPSEPSPSPKPVGNSVSRDFI